MNRDRHVKYVTPETKRTLVNKWELIDKRVAETEENFKARYGSM
jgi:hypothetical protein